MQEGVDKGDADEPAALDDGLDLFVGQVAVVVADGCGIAVRGDDRLLAHPQHVAPGRPPPGATRR